MTLVAAVLFGLVCGFIVRGVRRASLTALAPWLAVLALQTWLLGTGRGHHPASTIRDPGYWLIQAVAGAVCLGIAAAIATSRARRATRSERHQLRHDQA